MKLIKSFFVISYEALMYLLFSMPRYRLFIFFKITLLRIMGAKIGKGVVVYPGVWIAPGRNLVIGDNVDLALGVIITTAGGVEIGNRTLVGYRTQIFSSNHSIPPVGEPYPISGDSYARVVIKNDVWIGANCVITAGVTIGEGALIAAGSVVTKDVPPFAVVAGVPARLLRMRNFGK